MWKTAILSTVLAHATLLLSARCVVADCVLSKLSFYAKRGRGCM